MAIINKDILGTHEATQNKEIKSRMELEGNILVGAFGTLTGSTINRGILPVTAFATDSIDGLLLRDSNRESVVTDAIVLAADLDNYGDFMTKGKVYARAAAEFVPGDFGAKVKVNNSGFIVPNSGVGQEINAYPLSTCPTPGAGDDAFQAVKIDILGL